MFIALAVAAFVAALIAFYSVPLRLAARKEEEGSGIPEPRPAATERDDARKAA